MQSAPLPPNETERLRILRLYRVLDSGSEKAFDDLTSLAATICETPMGAITLVDERRQWMKSRIGFTAAEGPRDLAFCAHALLQDDIFVVEDAREDERFADNPLVTSGPLIRFYAGAPLKVAGGHSLGTLCVVDRRRRQLTPKQLEALSVLRTAVVTQLELRRALHDFRAVERLLSMCAWCRSIRTAEGTWEPIHEYLSGIVDVTHSVCPSCAAGVEAEISRR